MLDADAIDTLDHAVDPAAPQKSDWYAYARIKKDQSLGASSDALEHDDFARLLAFVRTKLATLADALMAGQIAPHPVQGGAAVACDYCDFVAACPFDAARGSYHSLEKLKKREFLARLQHDEKATRGESS
jgi:ATP-dependent helicase/nuclease subunit B